MKAVSPALAVCAGRVPESRMADAWRAGGTGRAEDTGSGKDSVHEIVFELVNDAVDEDAEITVDAGHLNLPRFHSRKKLSELVRGWEMGSTLMVAIDRVDY